MKRYAIYYAPAPDSRLWTFACRWLGRDAVTGEPVERLHLSGVEPAWQTEITRSAAHYGFHATLKPPFRLAEGTDETALMAAVAAFAGPRTTFESVPMEIASLGGFLALVPQAPDEGLSSLADACVEAFDGFRAPPTPEEVARRRAGGLSAQQQRHLERWGYPYVFEAFRFHMTLTSRLDPAPRARVLAALTEATAPWINAPLVVDNVCLFAQADAAAPFALLSRCAFGGGDG